MILYGRNAVREALSGRRAHGVGPVWATHGAAREQWLRGLRVQVCTAAEVERRCGSPAHQGICAEAGGYPYVAAEELLRGGAGPGGADRGEAAREPLIVALDEVQDPQNLGSICRTAECVGATGLAIPERRAAEITPAACKASAGAVEHLRIARVRNLADFLAHAKDAGCWCYGASAPRPAAAQDVDGTSRAIAGAEPGARAQRETPVPYDVPDYRGTGVVLVLGSEGRGLRPRVANACDQLIALPLHGRVRSLNVSAAASALLYEILQKRKA